ncbi:MFS transporter [Ancylomarina longa]|uniref:MFS transporter n=1 Tax=Ancylomarina longa TaxID=2487017 RepID=A0A434AZE8_9BACT|nr:MFS transporter [Ancylomarina longa]RUT79999.1 MFS transporter [Ancylomarina longa]
MTLFDNISRHNFKAFLWHAGFLAFAQNFMDVDTVIPAMVVESGGSAMHIGIITAIMMGGSSFTQLFFAPLVNNSKYKKNYLLYGINLRVLSLIALTIVLYWFSSRHSIYIFWFVFVFISLFSLSGAFANISYVDIFGKTINQNKRKSFFALKQIIGGVIVLSTAFLAKKMLSSFDYPTNYSIMFLIGATALFIASLGFWKIKETEPSGIKISGFNNFIGSMLNEIKVNKKLVYFLGFINTQGIVISFIPFVMLYAKETFNTQGSDTGEFLLFKVIGVVIVSFMIWLVNKKVKYNTILYSNVFLSILLALLILLINNVDTLKYIFILGGIVISLFTITMNGLLLEISGNENRALYAGFAGAGNIIPSIFPLIAGGIISKLGYAAFFIFFMLIISFSLYFILKIKCSR